MGLECHNVRHIGKQYTSLQWRGKKHPKKNKLPARPHYFQRIYSYLRPFWCGLSSGRNSGLLDAQNSNR